MYDVRKLSAISLIAAVGTFLAASNPANAAPVAPDGAVGVNIPYDAGTSSKWFIEQQRDGALLVQKGIAVENDAEIRQGLLELDWGFNQQLPDGSFGTTGDPFHSTSLFTEAAARATLALKQYHPVSYALDSVYYNTHIANYTQQLHQAAIWMTIPAVAAVGQLIATPYTHRRYLLAADMAEIAALSGDTSLNAVALNYAQAGLALQLTSGVSGNAPVTFPNGVTKPVSLVGVNPEMYGYDVNYEAVGLEMAEFYFPYCKDAATRTALRAMLRAGLRWEYPWLALDGTVTYTGSTRVGVEVNRDGTLKQPDTQDISNAFTNGYAIVGVPQAQTAAVRMMEGVASPITDTVAADGADGTNIGYEAGTFPTWDIANQRSGVTVLQAGIQREDPNLIAEGCSIIDWGFAQQLPDGSFGTTQGALYDTSGFVETTARASALLAAYTPTSCNSNPQTGFYAGEAQKWAIQGYAAAKWMMTQTVLPKPMKTISLSPVHLFTIAAALQEQGALSGDAGMQSYAQAMAAGANAMQTPDGAYPEGGLEVFTPQSQSTAFAERIMASIGTSSPLYSTLSASVANSLAWLAPYIDPSGNVLAPGGAKIAASTSFGLQSELTDDQTATLLALRMSWLKYNNTLTP